MPGESSCSMSASLTAGQICQDSVVNKLVEMVGTYGLGPRNAPAQHSVGKTDCCLALIHLLDS